VTEHIYMPHIPTLQSNLNKNCYHWKIHVTYSETPGTESDRAASHIPRLILLLHKRNFVVSSAVLPTIQFVISNTVCFQ